MSEVVELLANFPNLSPEQQQEILNGPGLPPPNGVDPNFANPPNGNRAGIVLIVLCLLLSIPAMLGRSYARFFIQKRLYVEDYLAFSGFASYFVVVWVYLDYLDYPGFFVHQWHVPFKNLERISKLLVFGLTISWLFTILFLKVAILLEWARVFSPGRLKPYFYWACQSMILFTTLLYSAFIIVSTVPCIPLEATWKPWIKGRCVGTKNFHVATAVFNLIVDIILVVLPFRVVWSLQMDGKRKIGISLVFSVGLLGTACAAGRAAASVSTQYGLGDSTYSSTPEIMWAISEATCTVLVLCTPSIPKLFIDQGPLSTLRSRFRQLSGWDTRRSAYTEDAFAARAGPAKGSRSVVLDRGGPAKLGHAMECEDIETLDLIQTRQT